MHTGNMAPLAPLAPRPSGVANQVLYKVIPSDLQSISSQRHHDSIESMATGPLSEQNLPPRMRHSRVNRPSALDEVTIKAEAPTNPLDPGGFAAQPTFRHATTGSSDSGIDMTVPCQPPIWSQSPNPINHLANGQFGAPIQEANLDTSDTSSSYVSLNTPNAGLYHYQSPDDWAHVGTNGFQAVTGQLENSASQPEVTDSYETGPASSVDGDTSLWGYARRSNYPGGKKKPLGRRA